MGAEQQIDAIFGMLLAIFSHKWLEAFALGCSLHYAKIPTRKLAIILFFYSVTTPLGIAMGMVIGEKFLGIGREIS